MDTVRRVMELLDRWRHLPNYQLERRADVFFALYLPEFLSERLGVKLNPSFVPELPLRRGMLYPGDESPYKSRKADYLAVSRDLAQGYLIELKTDLSSLRPVQNDYLQIARRLGVHAILRGVVDIALRSEEKHKYCCLLRLLEDLSLVRLPGELDGALASKRYVSAVAECLTATQIVAPAAMQLRVVYLLPVASAEGEVGFAELADWLERRGGTEEYRFAMSLRNWARHRAGSLSGTRWACGELDR